MPLTCAMLWWEILEREEMTWNCKKKTRSVTKQFHFNNVCCFPIFTSLQHTCSLNKINNMISQFCKFWTTTPPNNVQIHKKPQGQDSKYINAFHVKEDKLSC